MRWRTYWRRRVLRSPRRLRYSRGFGDLSQTSASVDEAEQDVGEFLEIAGVRTAPITDKEAHTALAAFFSLR